jgi:F0F1-type ATP synthase assembly protein I
LTRDVEFWYDFRVRDIEARMNRWVAAFRLTGVGFFIAACILIGVFGGLWLDNKFDTEPLFTIGGLLGGLVIAVFGVYRMIRPLMSNRQDKENG